MLVFAGAFPLRHPADQRHDVVGDRAAERAGKSNPLMAEMI